MAYIIRLEVNIIKKENLSEEHIYVYVCAWRVLIILICNKYTQYRQLRRCTQRALNEFCCEPPQRHFTFSFIKKKRKHVVATFPLAATSTCTNDNDDDEPTSTLKGAFFTFKTQKHRAGECATKCGKKENYRGNRVCNC